MPWLTFHVYQHQVPVDPNLQMTFEADEFPTFAR
jgi:hypothetical protein